MKTVFKIFGQTEEDVINQVSLSADGLDVENSFGKVFFEPLDSNGFVNEFNTEIDAFKQLQQMEKDGFFESWTAFEVKRLFIK